MTDWNPSTTEPFQYPSDYGRQAPHAASPIPENVFKAIDGDAREVGGAWQEPEVYHGSVGRTMFDTPSSDDTSVTVLVPRERVGAIR